MLVPCCIIMDFETENTSHEFDTWLRTHTSKLEAQLLSLTLDMGTIVAETCKLNSEACNEHVKATHFKEIWYREFPTKTTCCSFE